MSDTLSFWPSQFPYIVVCSDSSIVEFESLDAARRFLTRVKQTGAYLVRQPNSNISNDLRQK